MCQDPLLRFYDECPRYQLTVKLNQTAIEQFSLFEKSQVMQKNAQRMQKALNVSLKLTAKDAAAIYGACAYVANSLLLYANVDNLTSWLGAIVSTLRSTTRRPSGAHW